MRRKEQVKVYLLVLTIGIAALGQHFGRASEPLHWPEETEISETGPSSVSMPLIGPHAPVALYRAG